MGFSATLPPPSISFGLAGGRVRLAAAPGPNQIEGGGKVAENPGKGGLFARIGIEEYRSGTLYEKAHRLFVRYRLSRRQRSRSHLAGRAGTALRQPASRRRT